MRGFRIIRLFICNKISKYNQETRFNLVCLSACPCVQTAVTSKRVVLNRFSYNIVWCYLPQRVCEDYKFLVRSDVDCFFPNSGTEEVSGFHLYNQIGWSYPNYLKYWGQQSAGVHCDIDCCACQRGVLTESGGGGGIKQRFIISLGIDCLFLFPFTFFVFFYQLQFYFIISNTCFVHTYI